MAERLIILDGPQPREVIPEGDLLEVGRAPRQGIVLLDRSVSRRHALVRRRGGGLTIEDLGSSFGTFVNEQPLIRGESVALKDGDVVRIGQVQMICRIDGPAQGSRLSVEDAAFAAQANARLLLLEGDSVRRQPLAGAVTLIGCAPHCEVRLQDHRGPPEAVLLRAMEGAFRIEPRCAASPPRLNESQEPVLQPVQLPTNSAFLVHQAQVLFLYDFGPEGVPALDLLARIPKKVLLRRVEEQCGISRGELLKLAQGRRALGQALGETLVERRIVTPLFWRVISARILEGVAPARDGVAPARDGAAPAGYWARIQKRFFGRKGNGG